MNWKAQAFEHGRGAYPREACGLVVSAGNVDTYRPCRNLSRSPDDFMIDPQDFAEAEDAGDIKAVVHTHPDAPAAPSQGDLVACEVSGLPWHILSLPAGSWGYCHPKGYRAPLLEREFHWGILDCWSLIRDAYHELAGIDLPDFKRDAEFWKPKDGRPAQDLYRENVEAAGCRIVHGELRRLDILVMQVRSDVGNHGAVYLGDGLMLHHLYGQLSRRDVYGGYWARNTLFVCRHKQL